MRPMRKEVTIKVTSELGEKTTERRISYLCRFCNFESPSEDKVLQHMKEKHSSEKIRLTRRELAGLARFVRANVVEILPTGEKEEISIRVTNGKIDIFTTAIERNDPPGGETLHCLICGFETKNREEMVEHIMKHYLHVRRCPYCHESIGDQFKIIRIWQDEYKGQIGQTTHLHPYVQELSTREVWGPIGVKIACPKCGHMFTPKDIRKLGIGICPKASDIYEPD